MFLMPSKVSHIHREGNIGLGHMPALQMKTKSSAGCLREGDGLHVCRQSTKISKSTQFQVKISQEAAVLDSSIQNHWDAASNIQACGQDSRSAEEIDCQYLLDGAAPQHEELPLSCADYSFISRSGSHPATCPSILETIFSPIFEPNEVHWKPINHSIPVVSNEHPDAASDDSDDGSSSSSDSRTCNVSDFHISDMSVASLPFDENTGLDDIITADACPDYECTDPDMMFDMVEGCMMLPFLEETVETSNLLDRGSIEEAATNSDDACLYLAIQQMKPSEVSSHCGDLDEVDDFDPHSFLRNLPDLSEVVPSLWPVLLPKETRKRKPVTLVLDLDETLVHSTLEHCDDADFTFPVYFNMKEHTVYVRQRPHLQIFLERVAEMFEIIVFTASQSIYAEQLLNILDPDGKLISRRVYRESCVFSDGSYTKDLTVLGLDLAKVAIIDNSPQVFRLQVNNGIPIKSWFDDPSDCALISLLPFLETLVDADDVRPVIAKRFNNKE
ncbi:uncharacterized protein LOC131240796 isoform X2 [Magnolia sinica]|uniref:uncharacterized protein LOC131240796 isoform X2 n=1 Tax=Magnolia sinica TaxID=86752 RepID=UPI002659C20C|nr:uncharacterized protein LOC131240796 isoform X2 [Magnolia sinica]